MYNYRVQSGKNSLAPAPLSCVAHLILRATILLG